MCSYKHGGMEQTTVTHDVCQYGVNSPIDGTAKASQVSSMIEETLKTIKGAHHLAFRTYADKNRLNARIEDQP